MSDLQKPFVHLHVHTEFSTSQGRDGLSKIPKLVARAKDLGMPALAITDHANMFGAMNFYRACKEAGIKPIIGVETYLAEGRRQDKDVNYRRQTHLLLIAKNSTGYLNLLKIVSEAQLSGFHQRPRVDKDLLAAYSDGLICTSGCLSAEIPAVLCPMRASDEDGSATADEPVQVSGDEAKARRLIGQYQDIFGKDNFFLELQSHKRLNDHLNRWLIDNQSFAGAPLVATNDVHYVMDEDFIAHDLLTCILKNKTYNDPKRLRHPRSLHLRTPDEMWDIFGDAAPSSLYNTMLIADMCELDLSDKTYHLPVFPVPDGYDSQTYLQALAAQGAQWRYGENWEQFWPRLEYELGIIHTMGFDSYFLIVWDLMQFARHADIWWNVRGSGAGSAVAYCLGITNLDPIPNNLIFERFLNPGRVSMPDIDIDFPDDRRFEMIEYAKRKYGEDKVAAIITFSQLKAKAAIVNVGRVMEYPLAQTRKLSALIPTIPSHPVTLAQCLSDDSDYAVPELKDLYNSDTTIRNVLDNALQIEGTVSHIGTHAAGVIVGDKPLVKYLPLHRPTTSNENSVPIKQVTQYAMEICESIGLLKVDFLGLSTLTIMRKACELIERYHGVRYSLDNIPIRPVANDPEQTQKVHEAFELIGSGEVTGVFQLESQGMRKMLVEMKPQSFEHITAAISLYRPGPLQFIPTFIKRLHNEEPIEYLHPKLAPILAETMGICVYQEQIQMIAAELFGYSLADADLMRRAVSKKKAKDLKLHKEIFMEKGPEQDVDGETASKIFDQIEFFAAYGFNKCLVGDTEVIDAESGRYLPIREIAEGNSPLTKTLTLDMKSMRLSAGIVTHVHENGIKPVFRLTTALGRQIDATENHPFYTYEGWQLLGALKPGTRVAVPRLVSVEGKGVWPDHELIVLGHLLAEGNLCHPHGLYYYTNDEEQWQDYVKHLEMFDNVAASTHRRREKAHDVYSQKMDSTGKNNAVQWIERLGLRGKDSYTKFIPSDVFTLTNRHIALLISRMWEGDGNIDLANHFAYYATSSERMGRQLQSLLLRLGIISCLRRVFFDHKDGRNGYQLHITGNENLSRFAETVGAHFVSSTRGQTLAQMILKSKVSFSTKDIIPLAVREIVRDRKHTSGMTWQEIQSRSSVSMTEFQKHGNQTKSGFTRGTIQKVGDFFNCDELRRQAQSDIYWDEIVSIEPIGEQMTYDLTVPETHNFIANDFIVHNSHAADYAVLTCQSAFLKAHYAAEYYIALLTVQRDVTEDVALFTSDCRRLGIPIQPPNINHSELDFTIEEGVKRSIRFGLGAIKFVSVEGARQISAERLENGLYKSLIDFCHRVDLRVVGSKGVESLIKVGAFDQFGRRDVLLANAEKLVKTSRLHHEKKGTGQTSLFGEGSGSTETDAELFLKPPAGFQVQTQREMLRWEKELIGLYVSDHPLNALAASIQKIGAHVYSGELKRNGEEYHGKGIAIAGLVTGIRRITTGKGDAMAIVTLEDMQGNIEAVFFPRTWAKYQEQIVDDRVFIVRGKADTAREGTTPQIIADTISQDFDFVTSASEPEAAPTWRTPPSAVMSADDGMDEAFQNAHYEEPPEESFGVEKTSGSVAADNENGAHAPTNNGSVTNGNGYHSPYPLDDFEALIAEDGTNAGPQRLITITIRPLPEDADARAQHLKKIRRLRDKLLPYPGGDAFLFRVTGDGQVYEMDFSDTPIDYDQVYGFLEQNPLVENVQISPIALQSE